ncbi:MAG: hypothetical protein KatS3mg111_4189 [Pirellulaceae bacterium]|nr:MAG: hypothetical protein KatS3mg111_4189 [Pirellulaceae bacterium]
MERSIRYRVTTSAMAAVAVISLGLVLAQPFGVHHAESVGMAVQPAGHEERTSEEVGDVPHGLPTAQFPADEGLSSPQRQAPDEAMLTEELAQLAAKLPPVDRLAADGGGLPAPASSRPRWGFRQSNLDLLIEKGPDVQPGPAARLTPLEEVGGRGSPAAGLKGWIPDPDRPLGSAPAPRLTLTRIRQDMATATCVLPSGVDGVGLASGATGSGVVGEALPKSPVTPSFRGAHHAELFPPTDVASPLEERSGGGGLAAGGVGRDPQSIVLQPRLRSTAPPF